MTMLIRHAGIDVEWAGVFALSGGGSQESVINFDAVSEWLYDEHGYRLFRYDNCTLEDICVSVAAGYPVMAIQSNTPTDSSGHNRVVIGYDLDREILHVNDPGFYGEGGQMSFAEFQACYEIWYEAGQWPAKQIMWILVPVGTTPPFLDGYSMLPLRPVPDQYDNPGGSYLL